MSDRKTFFGIPVRGEPRNGYQRVKQEPIENMQPLFEAVLNDPTIVEFGWKQYTPYFNDGEPCEFGISDLWVRTAEDAEHERTGYVEYDHYELEVDSSHPSLGKVPYMWNERTRLYVEGKYKGPDEQRYKNCKALNGALGGRFEDALRNAFGDHAMITVRKDGIEIEHYDHD